MKRILVATLAVAAMLAATPASARQAAAAAAAPAVSVDPAVPASYVGKWNVDIQSPQGAMQMGLDVKIDATNVVTGMLTGGPSGDSKIKGEFKDSKLGFGISFDAGGQMLEVWFEGVLKDGKLAGTAYIGDQMNFPWSAVRPKGL